MYLPLSRESNKKKIKKYGKNSFCSRVYKRENERKIRKRLAAALLRAKGERASTLIGTRHRKLIIIRFR